MMILYFQVCLNVYCRQGARSVILESAVAYAVPAFLKAFTRTWCPSAIAWSTVLSNIPRCPASFKSNAHIDIRPLSPLVQPVQLTQYDHWGRRIDTLHTSEGWRKLTDFVISNGLTRIQAVREQAEYSRLYAMTKCMVAVGDTHVVSLLVHIIAPK